MAYHGYIPSIKHFISTVPHDPSILEVGVDKGTTFIPLLQHLVRTRERFQLVGVDIKLQQHLLTVVQNIDRGPEQHVYLLEGNSLEVLPSLANDDAKFDVLLLDGDHNYYTVSRELAVISDLLYPHSIMLVDDYHGRWAENDLWYQGREGYESSHSTTPVETEKHGVAAAVNDWLAVNPDYRRESPLPGEPVVIIRVPNS